MPNSPALVVSLTVASLYGMIFFFWQGRRVRDLIFFWLASIVGFASGQVVGQLLSLVPWTMGQVHIVEGTLVAFLFLFLALWIRQDEKEK